MRFRVYEGKVGSFTNLLAGAVGGWIDCTAVRVWNLGHGSPLSCNLYRVA
jgi:hypothetical protein